ncbi:hypothetical protein LTR56_011367 [Elasticomyces elasticus]|nr:hypothetical protein LTR56_011367 [Elasticomyces elasticus]KAK3660969.1 hypothetical protein LTR22_007797 [Elasticomyces elasticus]KAK4932376.1 hypothetical protein LTR49_001245 [Elasticomyces elasticus]KAK5768384.1 hypothetical protein LTS12_001523 [Elasticomyces elasticus]
MEPAIQARSHKRAVSGSETIVNKRQKTASHLPYDRAALSHVIDVLDKKALKEVLLEASKTSATLRNALYTRRLGRVISFGKQIGEAYEVWNSIGEKRSTCQHVDADEVATDLVSIVDEIIHKVAVVGPFSTKLNAVKAICSVAELLTDHGDILNVEEQDVRQMISDNDVLGEAMLSVIDIMRPVDMVRLRGDITLLGRIVSLQNAGAGLDVDLRMDEVMELINEPDDGADEESANEDEGVDDDDDQ